jgi:hypothetical protein
MEGFAGTIDGQIFAGRRESWQPFAEPDISELNGRAEGARAERHWKRAFFRVAGLLIITRQNMLPNAGQKLASQRQW